MTCHVVQRCGKGLIALADSQMSGPQQEFHGAVKIIAGDGWLVGGAGIGLVIFALFEHLDKEKPKPEAVATAVEWFLSNEVTEPMAANSMFYVATQNTLQTIQPAIFKHARNAGGFTTIGSGAEFVTRAHARERALGILPSSDTLADLFVAVETSLLVADESLTVDNLLLMGLIVDGKSYLVGDKGVKPQRGPAKVISEWGSAADQFAALRNQANTIRGEREQAQRFLSPIATGSLDLKSWQDLESTNVSIGRLRGQLSASIQNLLDWYDARR